ncbi:hypothetical protein B0H19DRAFT_1307843 [Mycena capillaripes]|nr:hypothetical protein B0H19DRAFT_1307843 [Mycena capillaripes]
MRKLFVVLVRFSRMFKLNIVIPEDLLPILSKNEDRQRAIKQKSIKDAASDQAQKIFSHTLASRIPPVSGKHIGALSSNTKTGAVPKPRSGMVIQIKSSKLITNSVIPLSMASVAQHETMTSLSKHVSYVAALASVATLPPHATPVRKPKPKPPPLPSLIEKRDVDIKDPLESRSRLLSGENAAVNSPDLVLRTGDQVVASLKASKLVLVNPHCHPYPCCLVYPFNSPVVQRYQVVVDRVSASFNPSFQRAALELYSHNSDTISHPSVIPEIRWLKAKAHRDTNKKMGSLSSSRSLTPSLPILSPPKE